VGGDGHRQSEGIEHEVSTHAPAWGATDGFAQAWNHTKFQPTPPRGGRPTCWRSFCRRSMFQPTPPRGGRRVEALINALVDGFQPTPPRGGRLSGFGSIIQPERVSTHAPAWGATLPDKLFPDGLTVSTHAPAWGATYELTDEECNTRMFQPTPPRGGRQPPLFHIREVRSCFNPRPRVGGDGHSLGPQTPDDGFQPTPPRGGRHHLFSFPAPGSKFQPTPPRGGRRVCA